MVNLQRSVISLSTGLDFVVIHNLEWFGLKVDAALENWLARCDESFLRNAPREIVALNFCSYMKSKDPNIIALTGKQFTELKQGN